MADSHGETRQRYVGEIQSFAAACGERLTWAPERRSAARDDMLRFVHVFRSALLADPAILSYQIYQTSAGADIHVISAANGIIDIAALSNRVSDGLERAGVTDPIVEVTAVADLEHHAQSGKLRRFVPLPKST